jgi:hypothetical protein
MPRKNGAIGDGFSAKIVLFVQRIGIENMSINGSLLDK